MKKRASLGGKLEKAYKGLSLVVATFVALPTHFLFLTPVPVAYAHGAPEKLTICHATGNGYVANQPNKTADAGVHAGIEHQEGRDIIPPFDYDGGSFPGQNWDEEGQAIYRNDCVEPEPEPVCGDGEINQESEQCDGDDLGDNLCPHGGSLSCDESCELNYDQCEDTECDEGEHWDEKAEECVPDEPQCDEGEHWDGYECVPDEQRSCEIPEELIANGGFELPVVSGDWDTFATGEAGLDWIVEWRDTDEATPVLELQTSGLWTPHAGNQYAELDSHNGPASVRIYQDLPTIPGDSYDINYAFSPRPGINEANNDLKVIWDGVELNTTSADGSSNSDTDWTDFDHTVVASGSTTRIEFIDMGVSDTFGTLLDSVSAIGCPEEDKPRDVCPNINGIQEEVPEGFILDDGICVPKPVDYGPYCGDGEVNQEWEQCDAGPASSESCTAQCQLTEENQCSDLTLAKVTVDEVINEEEGSTTSDIFVGDDVPIPSGSWFLLYWNGLYVNDVDIPSYEDVEGLAVERKEGTIRTVLHGDKLKADIEHARGSVMLYNASVTDIASDDLSGAGPSNKLEKGFDGLKPEPVSPGNDEVEITADDNVDFWLTTNVADDGFYVEYEVIELCDELPYCGDGIVNQEWEQCDGTKGCTEQCQEEEQNECSDLTLAKIDIETSNTGDGDMTSDLYLGSAWLPLPNDIWFPLYWNGSYFTDPDITPYEDVPGIAVERQEGTLRAVIHGDRTRDDKEHLNGTIMLYNATVADLRSDDEDGDGPNNKLENPFDGDKAVSPGRDEVATSTDDIVDIWLTTTTADDGVLVDYHVTELCDELPYCGDGIVNQEWEQCDAGFTSRESCTAQCQLPEQQECNDLALAKVTIDEVINEGTGDMTDELFIGQSIGSIPEGVWFPLYWLGSYFTDPDISGYEDVPGMAIERQNGTLRTVMHGSAERLPDDGGSAGVEHSRGSVMLYNATAFSVLSDNATGLGKSNKLERGFDGQKEVKAGQDEVDHVDAQTVDYWMTTTGADDGFLTNYSIDETCSENECGNNIIETPETCDDGNDENGDGCSSSCKLEVPTNSCGGYSVDEWWSCLLQDSEHPTCGKYDFNDDGVVGGPDYGGLAELLSTCGDLEICKYVDVTGDGASSDDTPYEEGWGINVYSEQSTSTPIWTGVTSENGCISIEDLENGTYLVVEEEKDGWTPTDIIGTITEAIDSFFDVFVDISETTTSSVAFYNFFDQGGHEGTCGDQLDNDYDEFTDIDDRDCHTDGDPENPDSYDPDRDEDDDNSEGDGTCNNDKNDDDDDETDEDDSDCHTDGDPDDGDDTYDPDRDEETEDGGPTVKTTTGGGGGGGGGAPAGLNIHTEATTPDSPTEVTITWFTNVAATSRVVYDTVSHDPVTEAGPNYGYAASNTEDPTEVTFHSMTITGLTPDTTYYFRPVSSDDADTARGIELTISVTDDGIVVLGENTDPTPGGSGGPEPTPPTGGGTPPTSGGTVEQPEVLGLVAEVEAQEEEPVPELIAEEPEEEIEDGPSCSGLWFFPALDSLPFPWCKWWPLVLLLIIVAIYYYMTRNKDEEAPE